MPTRRTKHHHITLVCVFQTIFLGQGPLEPAETLSMPSHSFSPLPPPSTNKAGRRARAPPDPNKPLPPLPEKPLPPLPQEDGNPETNQGVSFGNTAPPPPPPSIAPSQSQRSHSNQKRKETRSQPGTTAPALNKLRRHRKTKSHPASPHLDETPYTSTQGVLHKQYFPGPSRSAFEETAVYTREMMRGSGYPPYLRTAAVVARSGASSVARDSVRAWGDGCSLSEKSVYHENWEI